MAHKILVIEDFELLRKMYTDILERFDYDIISAKTGTEGLELAQSQHPDLVLLDVDLPFMSGLEILYRLRQNIETRDIRVIMITGNPHLEQNEISQQADLILQKPVSPTDVGNFVQRLLLKSATA